MTSQQIVGKTIRDVLRIEAEDHAIGQKRIIHALEFTDGSFVCFTVVEDVNGSTYFMEPKTHTPTVLR